MKKLSKSIILIAATLLQTAAMAQPPKWQKSADWTLYNLGGTKFYQVNIDSLDNYPSRMLNNDSMHLFLAQVTDLSSDKPPVWMGAFVVSCLIDGKKKKIDISRYGGFLCDETTNKYYTVSAQFQKDWLNYLAQCAGSLRSRK